MCVCVQIDGDKQTESKWNDLLCGGDKHRFFFFFAVVCLRICLFAKSECLFVCACVSVCVVCSGMLWWKFSWGFRVKLLCNSIHSFALAPHRHSTFIWLSKLTTTKRAAVAAAATKNRPKNFYLLNESTINSNKSRANSIWKWNFSFFFCLWTNYYGFGRTTVTTATT